MSRTRLIILTVLLGGISPLGALGVDTVLPAAAAMADIFGDSIDAGRAVLQDSVAAFFLGAAFSQLIVGPLADRYGRRPVLLIGLTLYALAALAAAFAPNAAALIAVRFVHGLTSATGAIVSRAVARDLYDREFAARLISFVMVVSGIIPIFMPFIGGELVQAFGWQSVFLFMAAYTAVMTLACYWQLDETSGRADRHALDLAQLPRVLWSIARNRDSIGYIICLICVSAAFFSFIAGSESVLRKHYGQSVTAYGVQFGFVSAGSLVSVFFAGLLVVKFGIDRMVLMGTTVVALAGISMAVAWWLGFLHAAAIVIPMLVFRMGQAFITPAATAGALSPFPHMAGRAASLMGFLQHGSGAIIVKTVGIWSIASPAPMVLAIAIFGSGALAAYLFLIRTRVSG